MDSKGSTEERLHALVKKKINAPQNSEREGEGTGDYNIQPL